MKKFISGVVVGALLVAGVSAAADGVSLIGKRVSGIYTIEKDGRKVAEAAIINGSAYAPVRAVSEATGTTLRVEGKKITMIDNPYSGAIDVPVEVTISRLKLEIESIQKQVDEKQGGVKLYEKEFLPNAEAKYEKFKGTQYEQQAKSELDARQVEYEQRKAELADLQKQLEEIDAQIAELQK